jgi:hypothetical protein
MRLYVAVRGTSLAQTLSRVRMVGIYSRDECGVKTGRELASRRHPRNAEPREPSPRSICDLAKTAIDVWTLRADDDPCPRYKSSVRTLARTEPRSAHLHVSCGSDRNALFRYEQARSQLSRSCEIMLIVVPSMESEVKLAASITFVFNAALSARKEARLPGGEVRMKLFDVLLAISRLDSRDRLPGSFHGQSLSLQDAQAEQQR